MSGERRKRALQTKIRTTEPTVAPERTTGSDSFGRLQKLNLSQRFPRRVRVSGRITLISPMLIAVELFCVF